ncbi:MAG TPA: tetratricopeptide repeat protein [Bryobacteraceae bacterium]|nr:tetratricopeptide repeat protein [Bryobacteraceae bacterium]
MRTTVALLLFVSSLRAGTGIAVSAAWKDLHDRALAAVERNELTSAIRLLDECRGAAHSDFEIARTEDDIALVLFHSGKSVEARVALRRALEGWTAAHERAHVVASSATLAQIDRELGDYAMAERILRDAVGSFPPDQPLTSDEAEAKALALDELGDLLREEGRDEESRALLSEAARIPGISWGRVADATTGLAELDQGQRNWDQSIAEWNSTAELARAHGDELLLASAMRGLGSTWLERGDTARAEPLLRRALASFENAPEPRERELAATLTRMAQLYMGQNKLALAEDALTRALRAGEVAFGPSHPQLAVILEALASALARQNRLDLARDYLRRAIAIQSSVFGETSPMAGAAYANGGFVEQRARNFAAAAEQYERALAGLPADGPFAVKNLRAYVMQRYAESLKALHRNREAGAVLVDLNSFRAR